ncbi:Type VI secretion protein [Sulfitobacter noctilucicola]|uniref:Type VI secretion system protein ImpH n=1 Tax=Sulfitobacter noctilucicola TaxID=1342301 RepID=A0A7W6MC15_9RHOB|nr:type VI secretion system baseplate subunit TssG [Sulfitobacter noctilucicola]KIN69995.1 Type VI secretion protein [Sulfitobacter noctilucicola]MBB4176007.1 type VI secretion system protein ImpH [Sulfitobacter noctilucicola]
MATEKRAGPDTLSHLAKLMEEPEKHHIFQAMRVIDAAYPDAPRLGDSRRPREDRVRLGQEAELAFPPSTISGFKPGTDGAPGKLTNRFFGLFGPQGPLPLHLTEFARNRQRNHRDHTFVAFANMLTHRMMSLFYRAWRSGQPAASFDREDDPFQKRVAALAGYRDEGLQSRDALPDLSRRHFAAHLSQGSKHPDGLIAFISSFFGVQVELEQFVGCWLQLEPDDCWELGGMTGLGQTTSVGVKVWSRSMKFRLRVGPLTRDAYERFLPGGESFARLEAVVRSYVGDSLDWDVQLILKGDEVPRAVLGGSTRLGQTSWVEKKRTDDTPRPDAGDLFLAPSNNLSTPA